MVADLLAMVVELLEVGQYEALLKLLAMVVGLSEVSQYEALL
jgi:hypothetical protein